MNRVTITFRKVLPSDEARDLADEAFAKLHLNDSARCQVVLAAEKRGVHARILVFGSGMQIAREADAPDAPAALRRAFARIRTS